MDCAHCGGRCPSGAKFCPHCGLPLRTGDVSVGHAGEPEPPVHSAELARLVAGEPTDDANSSASALPPPEADDRRLPPPAAVPAGAEGADAEPNDPHEDTATPAAGADAEPSDPHQGTTTPAAGAIAEPNDPHQDTATPAPPLDEQSPPSVALAPYDQDAPPTGRSRRVLVAAAAVIAVLALTGALLLLRPGDETSNDAIAEPGATAVPTSETPTTAVVEPTTPTTLSPTTSSSTTSTTTSTTTTTTTTSTTTTTTTVPPPTTTPPIWAVPEIPPPPNPASGPGSPQIIAERLPSGLEATEVEPYFLRIQALADALAAGDWAAARPIEAVPFPTDADYEAVYGMIDRSSVILLNGALVGPAYELLSVELNLEDGAARTRVRCVQHAVDAIDARVQRRTQLDLGLWNVNATPEEVRNDPAVLDDLVTRCTFAALA